MRYETINPPETVSISSDGEKIAVGCYEWVYYFNKNGLVWSYEIDGLTPSEISISDDGEYVAIAGGSNSYYLDKNANVLWEFDTEQCGNSVKVSSDGEYIVLGSRSWGGGNGWVYYFNKDSNIPEWEKKTTHCIDSVDISSDGGYVVAGSHPTWTLYYFNGGGDLLFDYPIWVESTKISSDGKYIVAASWDNSIYFFGPASNSFYCYPSTAISGQETELTMIVDLTKISMNIGDPVQWYITTPGQETITGESDTLKCCLAGGLYDTAYYDFPEYGTYTIRVKFPGYAEYAEWDVEVHEPPAAFPAVTLATTLSDSYIVEEPITIGVSLENTDTTQTEATIEVATTDGFSDTKTITIPETSIHSEDFEIGTVNSGLYIATVNLYVDSILLDSISLPFTVRDPAAVKIADDNAKSLKMSAIDEFDEMAEVPASVSGSMIAQIGIDKLQKYVGDHFGTATDSVQNEDDSGTISDSDVQLITDSANETVDMIYDDISSSTSGLIIRQINERTGTNLPEDINIFELKESVSSEIYGKIKDVFEELFTGVLKDLVIKPLFTNSEERKVEQRDSEFDLYIQSTSFSLTDTEKTRLTQRFNEGCGAISSVTESKALFTIGPYSIPFVGEFSYAVTLREEKNKFEELEQLGVWIKYIVGALAVTGVVFTLLVSVLGTGGAVLLPLISALPHIITFLKTIMTTMIPVAKSFLLIGMFATVPIIAPEVTLQHDTTLDTVEDIIADIESSLPYSVSINKVTPMSSYIDHPSSITVALDNNEHISVQPITEIMVFSPDGRIIDIQRQDPYIKPHSSAEITEKLHIPSKPGTYNVLGMVHAGGVATSITQQSMPVSKPSLQINLSTGSRIYNIEDTIEITANFTNNEQSEIGNLTYVIEVINTTSVDADMIVLAASSSQIESISFTPDEEGSYIASAVLLLGFTEVASETIGFTVGSGEALIINTAAEDLYPPESDVTLQIIIDNIGTVHTDSSIIITTFDELTDFTQIYTNEIAVSLNPGASTTMHSVVLPNAMPGIYRTIIRAGDYSARSVEYTVTANGTIFTLLDTDKLYYNLTDTVNINITTNDILFNATNASVNVSIAYPNGSLIHPEVSGSCGNYTAVFDPDSNGTYEITASSQKTGFRTYSDETFLITGVRSVLNADLPSNNVLLNRSASFICNITNEHGTPVENAIVALNGCGISITKITDENGMVEFIIMPNATGEISFSAEKGGYAGYTGTVYVFNASGDLDRDGEITSEDVSMALDIVFGGEYVIEADVDENGYVNILDVRMIMQAAAGKIEI